MLQNFIAYLIAYNFLVAIRMSLFLLFVLHKPVFFQIYWRRSKFLLCVVSMYIKTGNKNKCCPTTNKDERNNTFFKTDTLELLLDNLNVRNI